MTLLQPPANWDATAWLKKEERFSTPALGFSFFYHQRHDQSRTAPGKVHCRLCKGSRRAGEGPVEAVLRRHSCLAAVAALAGGSTTEEPCVRRAVRATADTLNFKELFAGHAVLTAEWVRQGGRAMEPVEVFEQPHFHKGYRAEHDLLRVEVQEQHLLAARQGPENVAWIASPCTSFCDWGLQNGGTRTFDRPRGDEGGRITQKEEDGNRLSEFGAAYFEALLDNGGFPMCESTAPSGRYPKQWHLPAWKAVLQRPDVDYVDLDMCAFGLGPPDVAGQFYRHATRVVFPRHEPLRRALLRTCPGVSADQEQREVERLPCTRGPDGGDCGCCPACCQGRQGCGLCTKCWAQGIRRGWAEHYSGYAERSGASGGSRDEGRRSSAGESRVARTEDDRPEESGAEQVEDTCSYEPSSEEAEEMSQQPPALWDGQLPDVEEYEISKNSEFGYQLKRGRKRGICRGGPDGEGCGVCKICDPTEGFLEPGAPVPVEEDARGGQEDSKSEEKEYTPDDYPPDTWELCTGYVMVRHHKPRTTLFVPPSYGPEVLGPSKFRNERQTHIWPLVPMGLTHQVEYSDNWRLAGEADPGYGEWRGITYLTFQGRTLPWDSSSEYTNTTSTDPDDDGESPEEERDDDMPSTLEVIPEGDEEGSDRKSVV